MMRYQRLAIGVIVLLPLSVRTGMAAVQLGTPFGEHMVLQQGVPVPIWGTGCPGGDNVTLSFAGQSVTAKSDWAGRWLVILAPMRAGGPFQMLIQIGGFGPLIASSAATAQGFVELNDIVVGEVRVIPWKQPNPNWVAGKNHASGTTAIPSAWIRVFKNPARRPNESQPPAARWTIALPGTPDNYADVSYTFARELYNKLLVPIGVIESPEGP